MRVALFLVFTASFVTVAGCGHREQGAVHLPPSIEVTNASAKSTMHALVLADPDGEEEEIEGEREGFSGRDRANAKTSVVGEPG